MTAAEDSTNPPATAHNSDSASASKELDAFSWWRPGAAVLSVAFGIITAALIGTQTSGEDSSFNLTVFVIAAILIPPIAYFSVLNQMKKRLILRKWCEQNGWTFLSSGNPLNSDAIQHSKDINESKLYWHDCRTERSMYKQFGDRGVVILERYYYTQDSDGNDVKHARTFLVMDYGGSCPEMVIHKHHLIDKIKLPGHLQVVKFELPSFNKKWTVKATDPKAAYDRMDQSTLEYLDSIAHPINMEFTGNLLVIKHDASNLDARIQLMKFTQGLSKAVPDDLMPPLEIVSEGDKSSSSAA